MLRSFCRITRKAGNLPMRTVRLCAIGLIAASIANCGVTDACAIPLTTFRYEALAQRHCPSDAIVWLDFRKGIYYAKQQRQYARGFNGSFACREEARSSGYRRSLLGLR
jgi:hypothetical protein